MGEDQLLDLTLSTTKINHSLHSTAVQMIKNVHFCAKIFTSKVQFRLLLHTQVTKNLKNEVKMIDVCQGRWKQFEIGCAKKLKGKGGAHCLVWAVVWPKLGAAGHLKNHMESQI